MAQTAPRVQVEGAKELRAALRRMGDDLEDLKATHKAAAELVVRRGKDIVPHLTGALGGTIRPGATKTRGYVAAGRKAVPYAGPIHFGWPAHNISPQPFLYDALDDRRDAVVELYEARIEALVRKLDRETPG
jgi:hypothetical protein